MDRRACLLVAGLVLVAACRTAPPAPGPDGFVRVDGPGLRAAVAATDARLVLVNVWATWCAPCVDELPSILRVADELSDRGLAVVLVTTDGEAALPEAAALLGRLGAPRPYYAKTGPDAAFIDAIEPDWTGALPVTALFAPDGTQVAFWEGRVDYATLRGVLEEIEWP